MACLDEKIRDFLTSAYTIGLYSIKDFFIEIIFSYKKFVLPVKEQGLPNIYKQKLTVMGESEVTARCMIQVANY